MYRTANWKQGGCMDGGLAFLEVIYINNHHYAEVERERISLRVYFLLILMIRFRT